MKAQITKIGTFDEAGHPEGWEFVCNAGVYGAQYETSDEPLPDGRLLPRLIGGYTLPELQAIAATRDKLGL